MDSYGENDMDNHNNYNEFLASDVVKKIEKAKLYQMLLTCDFFDIDASDEDIVDEVTKEVRRFVHYKLECLLGVRNNTEEIGESSPQPLMPWNEAQIEALTVLANRLVSGQAPESKTGGLKKISRQERPARTTKTVRSSSPVIKRNKEEVVKESPQDVEENQERLANYRLQDNPEKLPMPSQLQIDTINAQLAESNSRGAFGSSATSLNGALGQILTQLVKN